MIKNLKNQNYKDFKKYFIKKFSLVFLILFIVYLCMFTVVQFENIKSERLIISDKSYNLINIQKEIIKRTLENIISDLEYIADEYLYYANKQNNIIEIDVNENWLIFCKDKKIYDQIRFIDVNGDEKNRINYNNGNPYIVPRDKLQNKKDRYYFANTINLKIQEIYVSEFDLNIENGEIEKPIKPMIRFSTPVIDDMGNLKGVIVLNYLAQDLIDNLKNAAYESIGDISLIDTEGYWIINKDSSKEWTFMYDDKKNISFKNEFSEEWQTIKRNSFGQFYSDKGLFTYSDIISSKQIKEYIERIYNCKIIFGEKSLKIVLQIQSDDKNQYTITKSTSKVIFYKLMQSKYILILLVIISILISALATLNKIANERIKCFAMYDTMTNALNRRAGIEQLYKEFKKSKESNTKLSICFIDINGLKEINDTLGHEKGDELIKTVANEIKLSLRASDFIIRLGGDEFLLVFPKTNEQQVEEIWKKINERFNEINITENRKYIISVSHGTEEYKAQTTDILDTLIRKADEKMYIEKKEIKKGLNLIK